MSHDITATPEATLTIKQMAAQSGMSEYTLRYYEKIGLIQPIPRDGMGYSLRVNVKKHEASTAHPDREPQFSSKSLGKSSSGLRYLSAPTTQSSRHRKASRRASKTQSSYQK